MNINILYLPPFSIVARFFLTASLFAFLGSIYVFIFFERLPVSAIVHTFTLGFMAFTMIGALYQVLPVVAGAVIERPLLKASSVHILLILGVPVFIYGLSFNNKNLILSGSALIFFTFLLDIFFKLIPLIKLGKSHTHISLGLLITIVNFLIGSILGFLTVLNFSGYIRTSYPLFDLHLSFMVFGWTISLIASVSFRVIEMFFVTAPFPSFLQRYFHISTLLLLLLKLLFPHLKILDFILPLPSLLLSVFTVQRLITRKRKIKDPLINFWYAGEILFIVSFLLFPFRERLFIEFLLFWGAGVSFIIMTMMYRIIPFLVWIHLSNRGIPNAPTMHEVISPKIVRISFTVHTTACIFVLLSVLFPSLVKLSILLTSISFCILFLSLTRGVLIYRRFTDL